jgi:hypothetical protein
MSPHRYRTVIETELGSRYALPVDGITVRGRGGQTDIIWPIPDSSHAAPSPTLTMPHGARSRVSRDATSISSRGSRYRVDPMTCASELEEACR